LTLARQIGDTKQNTSVGQWMPFRLLLNNVENRQPFIFVILCFLKIPFL
jgi:hypothetical protein